MAQSQTISQEALEYTAQDFKQLRKEGLELIRQLAPDTWTDHNLHDPGITILEQLCYAITDVAYRMGHNLPDLLADKDSAGHEELYTPAQVLSSGPVTLQDIRKIVIDTEGVKNAWIEPVTSNNPDQYFDTVNQTLTNEAPSSATTPIIIKGLYEVAIQKSTLTSLTGSDILAAVKEKLYAIRGLGEDFGQINVIGEQPIQVQAEIDIDDTGRSGPGPCHRL